MQVCVWGAYLRFVFVCLYVHVCMCVCMHVFVCVPICACMCVCMHVCVYMCMHVCVYAWVVCVKSHLKLHAFVRKCAALRRLTSTGFSMQQE